MFVRDVVFIDQIVEHVAMANKLPIGIHTCIFSTD